MYGVRDGGLVLEVGGQPVLIFGDEGAVLVLAWVAGFDCKPAKMRISLILKFSSLAVAIAVAIKSYKFLIKLIFNFIWP